MSKSVPKLRFQGFDEEWKNQTFARILSEFSNKSHKENEFPVLSSTNNGMELRNGRVSGSSNIGYKIISNGSLVLSPQNLWLGNININNLGEGLVSPSYKTFNIVNVETGFIESLLRTPKMLEHYKNSSTQGASVVRRNLEIDSFYQISLLLPNVEEQKKVSSFFKVIDQLISLQEKKIALLKEQKKGFLQKLFPKAGAKVPELRFADFDGDWKERKISDISETTMGGGTPNTSIAVYWNGDIPWIQSSNLHVEDLQHVNIDKFITEDAIMNSATKLVPANSIAIVTRVGVGKLALIKKDFTTSQDFLSLSNLNVNAQFALYSIYILLKNELKNIQGTSIKGMTKSDLLTKNILIPCDISEQARIGAVFQRLDKVITLHQVQLSNLKEQKKGLLQMVFV